jgi:hypothetical protein
MVWRSASMLAIPAARVAERHRHLGHREAIVPEHRHRAFERRSDRLDRLEVVADADSHATRVAADRLRHLREGQGVEHDGGVLDGASGDGGVGHGADERAGVLLTSQDAFGADPAIRPLEGDRPATGGWQTGRADRVGVQSRRAHAARHGRRRATRRSTGDELGIPGIAGGSERAHETRRAHAERVHVCLADDDRAGFPQQATAAASLAGTRCLNGSKAAVVLTPAVS